MLIGYIRWLVRAQRMAVAHAIAHSPDAEMRARTLGHGGEANKGPRCSRPPSFCRDDQASGLHLLSVQVLKQGVRAYIRILIRDVGLSPQCKSGS